LPPYPLELNLNYHNKDEISMPAGQIRIGTKRKSADGPAILATAILNHLPSLTYWEFLSNFFGNDNYSFTVPSILGE
jgi:hypothetical protein